MAQLEEKKMVSLEKIRNIGISAHIDSGKTTLSERILYYSGRIHRMQEVKGDGDGATMDFMDLERERGITITSAATQIEWDDHVFNLIDTPGHVDFTVEVERSLRVLDGAIMVLCAVGGVQSQSVTVDRQMKRYNVPRIAFINKMDRTGADSAKVIGELEVKLGLTPVALQMPIGAGVEFEGVIDLIAMKALRFEGENGEKMVVGEIPPALIGEADEAREKMLDALSMCNDELMGKMLEGEAVSEQLIIDTVRMGTVGREIVPVLMGTAYKNKGIQPLMDAVCRYLPSPLDRSNVAIDHDNAEAEVMLSCDASAPLVAMAFKVVDESFGQLTYTRVYQGAIRKGTQVTNARTGRSHRVGRIVRMHANEREDIDEASAGDIVALVAVDCASGDTFCDESLNVSLERMFIADPVIKLAVTPASSADQDRMAKALNRFMKEDPTFRVSTDPETSETCIEGMGELHLEIYVERMKREYKASVTVGLPKVSYREAPTIEAEFDYKHKKQTGGSGQYGHVVGRMVPINVGDEGFPFVFEDAVRQGRIPTEYIPACERGFEEAMKKGPLAGYEIVGVKMVLEDGSYHDVDSSEMAFRIAAIAGFRQAFLRAKPVLLEPIMKVEVECPHQYQGTIVGDLNSRRGMVHGTENRETYTVVQAEVPLATMFGYSTVVRSLSQGMATFSMELARYGKVPVKIAEEIIANRKKEAAAR